MSSQQPGDARHGKAGRPQTGDLPDRLRPIVVDALTPLGFDLETLDVQQAGRRKVVKVVVDADSGVGLDDIAEATRQVSTALDGADEVLAGPYTLEVTSPGVDRPLSRPRHWRRARYRLVRLQLTDGTELLARAGAADDDGVRLLVDGSVRWLPYHQLRRAVVEVEFKQPPATELALLDQEAQPDEAARPDEAAQQEPAERKPAGDSAAGDGAKGETR